MAQRRQCCGAARPRASVPRGHRFFSTPAHLRGWFDGHHATEHEVWIGFYRTSTGKPSVTWSESVDEALCVGWIDGIRRLKKLEAASARGKRL